MASLCLIFTSLEESPHGIVLSWIPCILRSCIAEICLDGFCMVRKQNVVTRSRQIYVGRGNLFPWNSCSHISRCLRLSLFCSSWGSHGNKKTRLCQEQDWTVNQQNKWTYKAHTTLQYIKKNCPGGDSLILTTLCQSFILGMNAQVVQRSSICPFFPNFETLLSMHIVQDKSDVKGGIYDLQNSINCIYT